MAEYVIRLSDGDGGKIHIKAETADGQPLENYIDRKDAQEALAASPACTMTWWMLGVIGAWLHRRFDALVSGTPGNTVLTPPDRGDVEVVTGREPEALQPHQTRVLAEKAELDARLEKLYAFINPRKGRPEGVSDEELGLLHAQYVVMQDYSEVLGERIDAFTEQQAQTSG